MPYRSSLCVMASIVRDGAQRQIEARNPALNAFVAVLADRALEEAPSPRPRGLLSSVPLTAPRDLELV